MSLNLYNILRTVLNESVDQNVIVSAINNKNIVRLKYTDDEAHATGRRTLEPYMLFIHKGTGNTLLLVYQWEGDTYRGKPSWKTLDIRKIDNGSWQTLKNKHFLSEPKDRFLSAPEYIKTHKYASSIIAMVDFDDQSDENGLYQPSLDLIRKTTQAIRKNELPSMDLSKLDVTTRGPIKQKKNNIYTSRPNSKKYAQYVKNVSDTERNADDMRNYWNEYDKAEQERQMANDDELDAYRGPIDDDDYYDDEYNDY